MAYAIRSGDTLSGLALKNKTTVQRLMALNPQIKDSNKIFAGASLNLPEISSAVSGFSLGSQPQSKVVKPPVTQAPVFAPAPQKAPQQPTPSVMAPQVPSAPQIQPDTNKATLDYLSSISGGTADTARDQLTQFIKSLQGQQEQYTTALKALPTAESLYTKYREQLGLPEKEARLQATEDLLNRLEDDINERISGKGIIESQRRRILASEQAPLVKQIGTLQPGVTSAREQLAQLMQFGGQDIERQAKLAGLPLDFQRDLLPTVSNLAEYQSPKEKLAQAIAQTRATEEIKQQYEKPPTPSVPSSFREWELAGGLQGTGKSYAEFIASSDKTTEKERAIEASSRFSSAFMPGAFFDGIKVLGDDGFIDPRVWKAAIADAPSEGLSRKEFIEQFGYLLNVVDAKTAQEYGLTPAEMKLLGVEF